MPKHPDHYRLPTAITPDVVEVILKQLDHLPQEDSTVIGMTNSEARSFRNSKVLWLPTDCWVSGMLAHFIMSANIMTFGYDLDYWSNYIQYTVYEGKGTEYGWHTDHAVSEFEEDRIRKLSISLCLSSKDDYEGGEFQIMMGNKMFSYKMDVGEAIVFPSDCLHRVRPLKSGKRVSLVAWYGGPKFK